MAWHLHHWLLLPLSNVGDVVIKLSNARVLFGTRSIGKAAVQSQFDGVLSVGGRLEAVAGLLASAAAEVGLNRLGRASRPGRTAKTAGLASAKC